MEACRMSALDDINARRLLLKVQESLEEALASKWDQEHSITLDQAKEAVQVVATDFAKAVGGELLTVGKIWQPKYAVVLTKRSGSRVFVSDDEANCKGLKRRFSGRRKARVWAKRRYKWDSYVFSDIEYRDSRPLEYITLNFTVSRTDQ